MARRLTGLHVDDDDNPDLTIVLLGNTGAGKSASGNTILGREAFESRPSFSPVTTGRSAAAGRVFGKQIRVIDTPGILGAEEQIKTWCQDVLWSCRPCLFLVVAKIDRFTEEEEKAVDAVITVLGYNGMKNSYLLFTGGDELDTLLQEYIYKCKRSSLRDFVKRFGDRYHLFNNEDGGQEQVRELLQKSECLRTWDLPQLPPEGFTIVLLGNSGVGKSAAGNKILGRDVFESRPSHKSLTTKISRKTGEVFEKPVTVIDTPGILCDHVERAISYSCRTLLQSSRRCLFLVVVRVGRFTEEDQRAAEAAIGAIGDEGIRYSHLLFTGGDSLKNMSLKQFIGEEESSLADVVRKFGDRLHLFNNEDRGPEEVRQLLEKSAPHLLLDRRIVLIGLSGAGKSSSGNTILGSDHFKSDCGFDSVSTETVSGSAEVEGRWVTVVDTPGFTSTDTDENQVDGNFNKMGRLTRPGPHVFVFVVRIGRMCREDSILLKSLTEVFITDSPTFAMVLFTHGDELQGQSIDKMIKSSSCVSNLVSKCGGRYCVFDNSQRGNRQQVRRFLDTVDEIVEANRGQYWDSSTCGDTYKYERLPGRSLLTQYRQVSEERRQRHDRFDLFDHIRLFDHFDHFDLSQMFDRCDDLLHSSYPRNLNIYSDVFSNTTQCLDKVYKECHG